MEGTCHGQVCIVVLGAHLELSVLAAFVLCVGLCGAWSAPMCWLMWCLECTYVLAICGAWNAPMCWLYVVLRVHLCVGLCGAWSAPMCWLYVVLGMHLCVGYMWCLE